MKKMNKTYEAPVAEVIEVMMTAGVLMESAPDVTGDLGGGSVGGEG